MKSFADYMKEDAGFKKNEKEDSKKEAESKEEEDDDSGEDVDKDEFVYNIENGPKAVYGMDSHKKNSKKQMKYTYSFGTDDPPFPYELTFISREFYSKAWDIYFTKGFDKLKAKDKTKIENSLYALEDAIEDFCGNEEAGFENIDDTESFRAYVPFKDKETKKIIEDFFKSKAKFSTLKHLKYKFNSPHSSHNEYYFGASLEKKK